MKQDKISIIMPCFNAEARISESVASALNQTYYNIELIVVNDGSTDRSLQILQGVNDSRLKIINQSNRGVCAARNRGLAGASGDYIAFLDSDDFWNTDCLEKLYNALQSEPEAVLAYCGWQNVGLPGGRGEPYIPPDYESHQKLESLLRTCPWPIHAALTRRSAIEAVGGFDEQFSNAEDYGLWLWIASFYKIVRVPEVLAFYHFHEWQQASKNRVRAAKEHWLVQQKFLRQHSDVVEQIGHRRIRQLTHGELLKSGYICYWERDLESARKIFRMVMKKGYGSLKDWKYMIPAILPLSIHYTLIQLLEKKSEFAR